MKSLTIFSLAILLSIKSNSQCDSNYLFKKGNKIQISTYWWMGFGKFKELPKMTYEVKQITDSSDWKIARILKTSVQNKGNSIFQKEVVLKCSGKNVLYDVDFWLIDTILQKELVKQMNIKTDTLFYFASGSTVSYPFSGNTNDNLPTCVYTLFETDVFQYADETTTPSNVTITNLKMAKLKWTSREVNFDSRIIAGIQKITTSAGTWDCYKIINRDTHAKGSYKNGYTIDYFAPGFGLVRTESYYGKRMTAYSEVTAIL